MRIAFFDTKKYDKNWFDKLKSEQDKNANLQSLYSKERSSVSAVSVIITSAKI